MDQCRLGALIKLRTRLDSCNTRRGTGARSFASSLAAGSSTEARANLDSSQMSSPTQRVSHSGAKQATHDSLDW